MLNFLGPRKNNVLSAINLQTKERFRLKSSSHDFKKKRKEIPGKIKEFNSITKPDGIGWIKPKLKEKT